MQYTVIIERGATNFEAYGLDLPNCVAVGETREEAKALIQEAIEFHLEGLKAEGVTIPEPMSTSELVEGGA